MAMLNPKLLVVTNMGPKPSNPFQGQFVAAQVAELQAQGYQAEYYYMRWHSDSLLNRLLKYPVFFLQFCRKYLFSRTRYDIIHVHFFYPTIWLALLYRWLRNKDVKIVVTCHGSDIYLYQPAGRAYRWCAQQVQAWIFTSKALSQQLFFTPSNQQVLSAGIQRRYSTATFRAFNDKDIDILYVGTLDKNKGMDRLLAALPELTSYRIVIAGSGPWQTQLQAAAAQFDNVTLLGAQSSEQLLTLYQRARCFISLSRNESFGLVMAEAMACYTPVLATDTDGAKAQVVEGVTGYRLAQQGESQLQCQFIDLIKQLLTLPATDYQQMQYACRAQAEQVLLPEVVQQLITLYRELSPLQSAP